MANGAYHKRDLYSDVTARILAELESGAAPWIKPWSSTPGLNHPHNAATSRPYSGCNVVLLWMTEQRHGYTTTRDRSEPEGSDDAVRMVPMLKEYTVFNVAQ